MPSSAGLNRIGRRTMCSTSYTLKPSKSNNVEVDSLAGTSESCNAMFINNFRWFAFSSVFFRILVLSKAHSNDDDDDDDVW